MLRNRLSWMWICAVLVGCMQLLTPQQAQAATATVTYGDGKAEVVEGEGSMARISCVDIPVGGITVYFRVTPVLPDTPNFGPNPELKNSNDFDVTDVYLTGANILGAVTLEYSTAGSATFDIEITTFDDKEYEEKPEKFTISIEPNAAYNIGAANTVSYTIKDNDPAPPCWVYIQSVKVCAPGAMTYMNVTRDTNSAFYDGLGYTNYTYSWEEYAEYYEAREEGRRLGRVLVSWVNHTGNPWGLDATNRPGPTVSLDVTGTASPHGIDYFLVVDYSVDGIPPADAYLGPTGSYGGIDYNDPNDEYSISISLSEFTPAAEIWVVPIEDSVPEPEEYVRFTFLKPGEDEEDEDGDGANSTEALTVHSYIGWPGYYRNDVIVPIVDNEKTVWMRSHPWPDSDLDEESDDYRTMDPFWLLNSSRYHPRYYYDGPETDSLGKSVIQMDWLATERKKLEDGSVTDHSNQDYGLFLLKRTGDLSEPLTVYFRVGYELGDVGATDFSLWHLEDDKDHLGNSHLTAGEGHNPDDALELNVENGHFNPDTLNYYITFPANLDTTFVQVRPVDDDDAELPERIYLVLVNDPNAVEGDLDKYTPVWPTTDYISIRDNDLPIVWIIATDDQAGEGGDDPGYFTVYREGGDIGASLTVHYEVSGEAEYKYATADYVSIANNGERLGLVTIAPGETAATIRIDTIDDDDQEFSEDIVLKLIGSETDYSLGRDTDTDRPNKATVWVVDDDQPTVTVSVLSGSETIEENITDTPCKLKVERTPPAIFDLEVYLKFKGSAEHDIDYEVAYSGDNGSTGSYDTTNRVVTFVAGQTIAYLDVTPINNEERDGVRSINIEVLEDGGGNYFIVDDNYAVISIYDDDGGLIPGEMGWNVALGLNATASPAMDEDGVLYVPTSDGTENHYVYAIQEGENGDSATTLWGFKTLLPVYTTPAIGPRGTIYFGSDENIFYALNPDGTVLWSYTTQGAIRSSPAVARDGSIVFGSNDGRVYSLSSTGTKKWHIVTDAEVYSSPAVDRNGNVFIGSNDGYVYMIEEDGDIGWSFDTKSSVRGPAALGTANTVYIGNDAGKVFALRTQAVLPVAEEETASRLVGARRVEEESSSDDVKRLDRKIWEMSTENSVWASPVLASNGTIYVGSRNKKLYAINGETGSVKWSYETDAEVTNAAAILENGTLYLGTTEGRILLLESATGDVGGTYSNMDGDMRYSPIVSPTGIIYAVNASGMVYAIGGIGGLSSASPWPTAKYNNQRTSNGVRDVLPPTLTMFAPTSGTVYETTQARLSVVGSAMDDIEVAEVKYSYTGATQGNGIAEGTESWNFVISALNTGVTNLTIRAYDGAGNEAVKTLVVSYSSEDDQGDTNTDDLAPRTDQSVYRQGDDLTLLVNIPLDSENERELCDVYLAMVTPEGTLYTLQNDLNWAAAYERVPVVVFWETVPITNMQLARYRLGELSPGTYHLWLILNRPGTSVDDTSNWLRFKTSSFLVIP